MHHSPASGSSSSGAAVAHGDQEDHQYGHHEQLLQWMWADAGAGLGGMFKAAAKANPLRWSAKLTPQALRQELLTVAPSQHRPVRLCLCGQPHELKFSTPALALQWLEEAQDEIRSQTQGDALGVLNLHRVPFLVPAAVALFLRTHAKTGWLQKNIFVAAGYARRITQCPRNVVHMQAELESSPHRRFHCAWEDFHADPNSRLFAFINEATKPFHQRGVHNQLEGRLALHTSHVTRHKSRLPAAAGALWTSIENSRFWMAWRSESGGIVIAFRGGDGGVDDQCDHPGRYGHVTRDL